MVSRFFFLAAFGLLGLGVVEGVANATGYTIITAFQYRAGRLVEFAAVLLVFVIAMQLREMKEALKSKKP